MNKELYEKLINELNEVKEPYPAVIRDLLAKNLTKEKSKDEVLAIISAFYDYTNGKDGFNFLKDYFHKVFSSYFSKNVIENDLIKIIEDDLLLEHIFSIGNKEVIENIYKDIRFKLEKDGNNEQLNKCAQKLNKFDKSGKFKEELEEMSKKANENLEEMLSRALEKHDADSSSIQNNAETERVENRFNASRELGVPVSTLNRMFDKKGLNSDEIDQIIVDPELANALSDQASKICSLPKNCFERFRKRLQERKFFDKIDVTFDDGKAFLGKKVTAEKKSFFSKVASTDNEFYQVIKNSAKRKKELLSQFVKIDPEVSKFVKKAIKNTNEKIKQKYSNAKTQLRNSYENTKNIIGEKKDEVKAHVSDKLYDWANKLAEENNSNLGDQTPKINSSETIKSYTQETVTSPTTEAIINGKKVIVKIKDGNAPTIIAKGGTNVGSIPSKTINLPKAM